MLDTRIAMLDTRRMLYCFAEGEGSGQVRMTCASGLSYRYANLHETKTASHGARHGRSCALMKARSHSHAESMQDFCLAQLDPKGQPIPAIHRSCFL